MWCLCQGLGPSKSNSACRETVIPRVLAPTPPSTRFIQVRVTKKRHDRPPDVESGHPPLSHTCHPGQIPNCPKSGKNSKFRLFPIRSQMPPNAMKRRKTSPKRRFQLPFPTDSSLWHHLGTPGGFLGHFCAKTGTFLHQNWDISAPSAPNVPDVLLVITLDN